jgi:hypothetical protein
MLQKVKNILTKSVKNLNREKVSLRWFTQSRERAQQWRSLWRQKTPKNV